MKKMNKKGFTLMEMLIVIAIIAILIAIAIPTFTAALEKSRAKTDLANARALKSLVITAYMDGEDATLNAKFEGTSPTGGTFFLSKNGQTYIVADAGSDECMKVTAKANKSAGDYVTCTFDGTMNYTGGNPNITDNMPT